MRFAHLADCHIGSWREPKLSHANAEAFSKAVDSCIENNVDFILISGDLFNTSLPSIDSLKHVVKKLKQLKDSNIPVYTIPGSHDFSPSGKTMLEVLEKADLLANVSKADVVDNNLNLKFTTDKKTGAKITGLLGKKGGLEKDYYESLVRESLENEPGYKIFLFHSALTELKPESLKDIDSHPISLLPKNFNYYAGGHPHFVMHKEEQNYGIIAYPGPLFPNNFKELEELERGGFYIVNVQSEGPAYKTSVEHHPVQIHNVHSIKINANHKTPELVEAEISEAVKSQEFNNTIITLRIEGILESGRPSDIRFKDIFEMLYNKSTCFVMKNTSALASKELEELSVQPSSVDEIENRIIKEHLGQIKVESLAPEKEELLAKELMQVLNKEKEEGETNTVFEERLKEEVESLLSSLFPDIF